MTMEIEVGIHTLGTPMTEDRKEGTLVRNMLIGKGFHWQRTIQAILPGTVRLSDGECGLINRLPVERYLECVVGSEMNPAAPVEFLKAHAVISRSWAVGKIRHAHNEGGTGKIHTDGKVIDWDDTGSHTGFDVCSDDHCQRYQGIQTLRAEVRDALANTAGEVLVDGDGNIVDARYSKCCGGVTELFSTCWQDDEPNCLESFIDPWCDLSRLTDDERSGVLRAILKDYDREDTRPFGEWETEVRAQTIAAKLREMTGINVGDVTALEAVERGPSGRMKVLRVTGTRGTADIGKELMIRRLLSPTHLYSSAFDIEKHDGGFVLRGRGWGHGVGLCQTGAARMALKGFDYASILAFYYPGSRIVKT